MDKHKGSLARKLVYLFLVLFFIGTAAVVYTIVTLAGAARTVTRPVENLMRQLAVEATPAIRPDSVAIVQEINDLARLETASMTVQQVVTAEREQEELWGLFGESLIFVAVGDVIAGVDLMQMSPADLQVYDPTTVAVHLPEAEIFFTRLDNERSYVADRDKGFLATADPQLETLVRQQAEQQLLAAALEQGILERADTNAEAYLDSFLRGLGFTSVTFSDTPPPTAPPYQPTVPKGYVVTPEP
ncbi:MAG: DUF4230 domain-containing protein [Chloroflexota bacterium]